MTERTIDAHERFAAEALLRALHTYQEAANGRRRSAAIFRLPRSFRSAVSRSPPVAMTSCFTIGPRAAENRRRGRAGLDLAAIITAHVARSRFVEESLIVSEERDLGYILQVIDGARNWAVHRNVDEYMYEHGGASRAVRGAGCGT